ncbi:MAG: hypothetical protein Phyf2KO_18340 [Phycisphaerales bacterium]
MPSFTRVLPMALIALGVSGCSFDITVHEYDHHWDKEIKQEQSSEIAEIEPPLFHADGNLHFSAQPDEASLLAEINDMGVTTVINFRRESEMQERVPFDEAEVVTNAGASYVHIPLGGGVGDEPGYDPEDVDRLATVLENAKGNVLLHCASGGRARTIWTAYLIKYEGMSEEDAIERAQKVGQPPSALDRLLGKPHSYTPPADDEG